MKIGIDIDEVIVEFVEGYLEIYKIKFGKIPLKESILSYNLWEYLDLTKEEAYSLSDELYESDIFKDLIFVEGALESVKKLSENHEIFFITARPEQIKEKTELMLKKAFPDINYNLLHSKGFYGGVKSKGEICRKLGINFMVEDHKEMALDCAKNKVKTFLLEKPWNRDCEDHVKIIKVKNWGEILGKIK